MDTVNNRIQLPWPEWKVEKLLGRGSFGEVYQVVRDEFGTSMRAAIKIIRIPMDDSEVEELEDSGISARSYLNGLVTDITNEIILMQALKGAPNIVGIDDYKIVESSERIQWNIYIRMELLTDLNHYRREHPLSYEQVIRLGCQICNALEICRKKKIVHRDIKPSNIFVSPYGEYKLGDFGISKHTNNTQSAFSTRKGTYSYMAPEVYRGEKYGYSIDIYSLGIVLYQLANNGRLPFYPPAGENVSPGDADKALEKRNMGIPFPDPANGGEKLGDILRKACHIEPRQRYDSPAEMQTDLKKLINGEEMVRDLEEEGTTIILPTRSESIEKPEESKKPEQPQKPAPHNHYKMIILAVVALLGISGAGISFYMNSHGTVKEKEPATENVTETDTEEITESEIKATEQQTEKVTENATISKPLNEKNTETESVAEEKTEVATESEVQTEKATEAVTEAEAQTEKVTEAVTETEIQTEEVKETIAQTENKIGTKDISEEEFQSVTETEFNVADLPVYDPSEYVTLGEYKGLTIEVDLVEVTDEDVMSQIALETKQTVSEGTVEEGDIVNIDYVGKIDGEEFEGGSAEGYDLEIGSSTFIDGFEEGIIGMQTGETKDLELTFPEDYHSEELDGLDVIFTVTVNSISRAPELTDEVAGSIVEGMTAEAYQESVRQDLEEQAKENQKSDAQQKLLQAVYDNATISGYPEENLQYTINRAKNYYEWLASMYGMTLDDYLTNYGMTQDEFEEQIQPVAEEALGEEMTLLAIAKEEDIEISDEEYQAGLERYAEAQEMDDSSKLDEAYGENYIRNSLLQEKVLDFLYENATIEETQN